MGTQRIDRALSDVADPLDLLAQLDQLIEPLDALGPAPLTENSAHGSRVPLVLSLIHI